MEQISKASQLSKEIRKAITTMEQANALIQKWSDKDLGPNPLETAACLEARNQVFGWGR